MDSLKIKKGDKVVVISGRDKGKQGKVLSTQPKTGKVVIEGINIVQRHTKPRTQRDEGGILKKEAAIQACKIMRLCPKCGRPTRTGVQILADGTRARQCKKCGETI
jgi:large subunit ribosomal protein L24